MWSDQIKHFRRGKWTETKATLVATSAFFYPCLGKEHTSDPGFLFPKMKMAVLLCLTEHLVRE